MAGSLSRVCDGVNDNPMGFNFKEGNVRKPVHDRPANRCTVNGDSA